MRALSSVVAITAAVAASAPCLAEEQVSDNVIQAWKKAGAHVSWVSTSGAWIDKPTAGYQVAFRIRGWTEGRFDALPLPEAPFHLDVSWPWTDEKSKDITDTGLKELIRFKNLRALLIFSRNVTDAGATEIAKLKGLEELDLSCTKVTAAGLKEIAKMRSITRLSLGQIDVREEMLREVGGFKRLTRLDFAFTGSEFTAAGIRQIVKLERLHTLHFFGVNVSDAAVRELARSKSLKDIDFLNAKVKEADVEELRKRLPGCYVSLGTVDMTLPGLPQPAEFWQRKKGEPN